LRSARASFGAVPSCRGGASRRGMPFGGAVPLRGGKAPRRGMSSGGPGASCSGTSRHGVPFGAAMPSCSGGSRRGMPFRAAVPSCLGASRHGMPLGGAVPGDAVPSCGPAVPDAPASARPRCPGSEMTGIGSVRAPGSTCCEADADWPGADAGCSADPDADCSADLNADCSADLKVGCLADLNADCSADLNAGCPADPPSWAGSGSSLPPGGRRGSGMATLGPAAGPVAALPSRCAASSSACAASCSAYAASSSLACSAAARSRSINDSGSGGGFILAGGVGESAAPGTRRGSGWPLLSLAIRPPPPRRGAQKACGPIDRAAYGTP
jgi:hypothetical protein